MNTSYIPRELISSMRELLEAVDLHTENLHLAGASVKALSEMAQAHTDRVRLLAAGLTPIVAQINEQVEGIARAGELAARLLTPSMSHLASASIDAEVFGRRFAAGLQERAAEWENEFAASDVAAATEAALEDARDPGVVVPDRLRALLVRVLIWILPLLLTEYRARQTSIQLSEVQEEVEESEQRITQAIVTALDTLLSATHITSQRRVLREGPDSTAKRIESFEAEAAVRVLETPAGGWWLVECCAPEGNTWHRGWMYKGGLRSIGDLLAELEEAPE